MPIQGLFKSQRGLCPIQTLWDTPLANLLIVRLRGGGELKTDQLLGLAPNTVEGEHLRGWYVLDA